MANEDKAVSQAEGERKNAFWADAIAQQTDEKFKQVVSDGKTPSGRIHVGSLRGMVIHDIIFKALVDAGRQTEFIYRFDDLDPMDSFPSYLPEEFKKYMGAPLCDIPSPEKGFESYAKCYALEFQSVFESLGCTPKVAWASQAYRSGKMDALVRTALEKSELIRKVNQEISGTQKQEGWLPINVVCEKCGKIGTTIATDFDGKTVQYECKGAKYAEGCGNSGRISPFGGKAKLTWKAEWAAQFNLYQVTIEGAGKDHYAAGGSRQVTNAICEQVFQRSKPYDFAYEFFLLGGKKMSSSKGVGASAREVAEMLSPELMRFLMARYKPRTAIDFNPDGETIPRLFDDFDSFGECFFGRKQSRDPDEPRIFQMSQVREELRRAPCDYYKPEFSLVAQFLQIPHVDLRNEFAKRKGTPLEPVELAELEKRTALAKKWLERFAGDEHKLKILDHADGVRQFAQLKPQAQQALGDFSDFFATTNSEEEQWARVKAVCETHSLSQPEFFTAAYLVLIGRPRGPKLLPLINALDKNFVVQRLKGVQ